MPLPAPPGPRPARARTAMARVVDGMLIISLVVAAGGVGYAVGHLTAPAATPSALSNRGLGTLRGSDGGSSSATEGDPAQVAALPSEAPWVPDGTNVPGSAGAPTETQSPATGSDPSGQSGLVPRNAGRGGLMGTVSAVDATTLTVATSDGGRLEVTTTDTTAYHEQVATTRDVVTVGTPVRVTVPGSARSSGSGRASAASPAAEVPPASASEVEILTQAPAAPAGGRGGRGAGLTGTVSATDESSITITDTDGQQTQVPVDASTVWIQLVVIHRDAIGPGSTVRCTVEGGFGDLRPGTDGDPGRSPTPAQGAAAPSITVSDVVVLLPAP